MSNKIYVVDTKTHKINKIKDEWLGDISCLYVNGLIFSYHSSSNQITFTKCSHSSRVSCIIETEDNHLISSLDY